MRLWHRVLRVLAQEGVSGVLRRIRSRLCQRDRHADKAIAHAKAEYEQLVKTFEERTRTPGNGQLKRYYWYHTIDLGNGLITPGDYDYRTSLPSFQFPANMRGMRVLDVGSATGFFAFEFERRGADVVSVELPSIAEWDMPAGEGRERTLRELMQHHQVETIEDLHYFHLDGPFEFCRRALDSKVTRCYSRIYDLSPAKLGVDGFDLIFVGDVLLHTFSPLAALASVAPLCRGVLVIAQSLAYALEDVPIMVYTGGDRPISDSRTWWQFNRLCLEQMLKRVGFRNVALVGRYTGVVRREWGTYDRAVIHAIR